MGFEQGEGGVAKPGRAGAVVLVSRLETSRHRDAIPLAFPVLCLVLAMMPFAALWGMWPALMAFPAGALAFVLFRFSSYWQVVSG